MARVILDGASLRIEDLVKVSRKVREKVSMVKEDRALASDIHEVYKMISDGSLLEVVESAVGSLN